MMSLASPHDAAKRSVSAAITLKEIGKTYQLYASPGERMRALLFGAARTAPRVHHALSDISLAIQPGETVGVLGVNGAGKSTLLQIVTGVLTPSAGEVVVNGRIAALLELGAGFNPALTGRQNAEFHCRLGDTPTDAMATRMAEIEAFADIGYYFDQPMRTYSSGMYIRVAFAAAISVDPDILIIDEALAVGDGRFQNKCYRRFDEFKAAGKTILLVTHSPELVTRHCTRGIVLDKGRLVLDGSAAAAAARYVEFLYESALVRREPRRVATIEKGGAASSAAAFAPTETPAPGFVAPWDRVMTPQRNDGLPDRAAYNPSEHRTGNGAAAIVDAAILLNGESAPMVIESGAHLSVAMQARSEVDVAEPVYTIRVKTLDDVLVWSYSTHWARILDLAKPPPALAAGTHAVAIFDFDMPLTAGEYFIDLAVGANHGGEIEIFDWRMSVFHLFVKRDADFYGLVDLKGECRTMVLPPAASSAADDGTDSV